jgi:hypothetical protein
VELYAGIDLHSNNSVVTVLDAADRTLYAKRLPNVFRKATFIRVRSARYVTCCASAANWCTTAARRS